MASPSRMTDRERQCSHGLDDLRHALSDRIERAREDGDVVAVAVHLDAHAVELPLDRGRLDLLQRRLQRRRGLGEHRLHRTPDLQVEAAEPCGALRQRGLGDGGQVAREHRRPAHGGRLDPGGGRDGVGDDAGERALAQLAAGQHREEALLVGRGAREQPRELLPAHRAGAGPRGRLDARERAIDLGDLQARSSRGRRQVAQGRPADAGAALAQLARQVADDERDLVRRRAAQAVRERRDLGQPRARGSDCGGGGDELGEQHPPIVRESRPVRSGAACRAPSSRAAARGAPAAPRARRPSCGTRRRDRQPPRAGCRPCAPSARALRS